MTLPLRSGVSQADFIRRNADGVAAGLAEVMAGLGVEKLDKLMPDVVQTASKVDIASHVRDGYIMMFIYLPLTFGDKFTPYVGPIIPCILKVAPPPQCSGCLQRWQLLGREWTEPLFRPVLLPHQALADENEYVRDTALRAGQRIISMYAETAIALLLPELEQGLFDDLWRIRSDSNARRRHRSVRKAPERSTLRVSAVF